MDERSDSLQLFEAATRTCVRTQTVDTSALWSHCTPQCLIKLLQSQFVNIAKPHCLLKNQPPLLKPVPIVSNISQILLLLLTQVIFWQNSWSLAPLRSQQKRFLEEDWWKKRAKVRRVLPSVAFEHQQHGSIEAVILLSHQKHEFWKISDLDKYYFEVVKWKVPHVMINCVFTIAENADISSALSKLTEPAAAVPISKLSVSNMVHSARKHIRRHRRDESPLNTNLLNSILLVRIISGNYFLSGSYWRICGWVNSLMVLVLNHILGLFFSGPVGQIEFGNVCVLLLTICNTCMFFFLVMLLMLMLIIPISLYINSVHLPQYLFPDAGVEKSSENDKTKAAHSNASGTAGQQGNSDDVCVLFFMTIWTHICAVILQS